ncbi:mCG144794, partial [Mus musculus]
EPKKRDTWSNRSRPAAWASLWPALIAACIALFHFKESTEKPVPGRQQKVKTQLTPIRALSQAPRERPIKPLMGSTDARASSFSSLGCGGLNQTCLHWAHPIFWWLLQGWKKGPFLKGKVGTKPPTNYTVEFLSFEEMTLVSTSGVQWISLILDLPAW